MPTDMEKSRLEQVTGLMDVAVSSLTPNMVTDLTEKAVRAVEMLDDLLQPEVLALIQKLPEVSASLERTLTYVQKMEKSGTLATLAELADFVAIAKSSMTGPMISDTMERAIAGLELVDDMVQKGVLDLAGGMVEALDQAQQDVGKLEKPMGMFQIAGMMKDPDVRQGLTFLMLFLKRWGASWREN
ncbi:DUF1641 domain-containing protein [Thermicanus aegyptius]|uniref:DUF1641 domain-containing protein n=1 Tax=Thermicanus aegyptius TaxID=94009 RepID=UPI000419D718|nr:DUF1641 domain-containing protein [Thermicanus aegyptius]